MRSVFVRSFTAFACFILISFTGAKAQYCTPTYFQGCTLNSEINDFSITGISSTAISDLATGCSTVGSFPPVTSYRDNHTTMSVTLAAGGTYTITANTSILSSSTGFQVFIDFNDNGSFLDAGESVGGGTFAALGAATHFPIIIPAGATSGSHRLRAVASGDLTYPGITPCPVYTLSGGGATLGEVHDYTAVITGTATTCPPVTGLSASSITSSSATISWTAATGATGYEWAVDLSATAPASGTPTTLTSANPTGLTAATTYYAHVRTNCGTGGYSTWVTIPFTTLASAPCPPVTGLAASSITSTSATISWAAATGATGYEWAVDMSATAPASGTPTTLTTANATGLTASTGYYAHVRTNCGSGGYSTWVTIPFTTISATACPPVTGLSASAITATSAMLNWTAAAGATGYEWAVDLSATAPASGTATTLTTATATGLTASTSYYAHVRTNCGSGGFSAWVTIPFTTTSATCAPITGLTASAITSSSATVSRTAIAGTAGYQYVIDNTVTAPAGSGTNTTITSTSPTGLTAATTYYAHVRDSCGVGNFSAWTTIPFTTLATAGGCNAPTGLTASGITQNSATIAWTPATGTVRSQWVVNTNPANPTTSGTNTTASTATATGLTPATLYYAHVRDSCGAGSVSAWVTIPLTTLAASGTVLYGEQGFRIVAAPNPVKDALVISILGTQKVNAVLQLTDITGKLILSEPVTTTEVTINMGNVAPGIYLVRYTDAERTQTIKVNKQ